MSLLDQLDKIVAIKNTAQDHAPAEAEDTITTPALEEVASTVPDEDELVAESVRTTDEANGAEQRAEANLIETPPIVAYKHKGVRYNLVLEGVCTHCAHCGHLLRDSESVERGIGPVCSKKGYHEDPKDGSDAMSALIALSEFPELVEWLKKKYVSNGTRTLVNGLVRTASLNRRSPVHAACTDAVEALGYTRLASLLRESISSVEISVPTDRQAFYEVWVKRSDFTWAWQKDLREIPGYTWGRGKGKIIRNFVPKTPGNRVELARIVVKHFQGLFVKTGEKATKITPGWFNKSETAAQERMRLDAQEAVMA